MRANPSPMSVADYCHDYNNRKIVVNDEYQRREGLWTAQAKSFFIESILLEYPIPKIYLYARLDLRSRQQIKEIVDGQQRSQALVAFFNNQHRLTKNIETAELRGLKYSQLPDEWQARFLSYSLPIDQFSATPEEEVREAFRRMNANNVPLNDEEQRNAQFQGPMKWFIVQLAERYKDALFGVGLFSKRDLIRMADLKFYAEIVHTMDAGFQTIKGQQLDSLYKRYNTNFPQEDQYLVQITSALDWVLSEPTLRLRPFMKPYLFQMFVLARIASTTDFNFDHQATAVTQSEFGSGGLPGMPVSVETLAQALDDPFAFTTLETFVRSSTQKTNVESQRVIRYAYIRDSLRR